MQFIFSNEENLPVTSRIKAGKKFTGLLLRKYTNGKMKICAEFKNGVMDGKFVTGHKNGEIASQGTCEQDHRVGLYSEFRENGQLSQQMRYPALVADFVIGIPYLEKTCFDESENISHRLVYTKPCWER